MKLLGASRLLSALPSLLLVFQSVNVLAITPIQLQKQEGTLPDNRHIYHYAGEALHLPGADKKTYAEVAEEGYKQMVDLHGKKDNTQPKIVAILRTDSKDRLHSSLRGGYP
jgi:hypothetical protein